MYINDKEEPEIGSVATDVDQDLGDLAIEIGGEGSATGCGECSVLHLGSDYEVNTSGYITVEAKDLSGNITVQKIKLKKLIKPIVMSSSKE